MKRSSVATSTRATNLLARDFTIAFSPEDTLTGRLRVTGVSEELHARVLALQTELPALAAGLDDAADADLSGPRDVFAQVIAELVISWDLVNDDDTPVPATVEALADFEFMEVLVIALALLEEVKAVPLDHSSPHSKPATKRASTPRRR